MFFVSRKLIFGAALFAASFNGMAQSRAQLPTATGTTIRGVVVDSLRGGILSAAIVQLQPTRRETITDSLGRYQFTNVPNGSYTVRVLHPWLDTLGVAVVTPTITPDGSRPEMFVEVAVPPLAKLIGAFCAPAQMLRGPAALVGFVRDPDTELPIEGARVSLVFIIARDSLGILKDTNVREATTDAAGHFRICGLPQDMQGKLQVERRGAASAEIPVEFADARLAVRGVSFSATNTVVAARGDSGQSIRLATGPARLSGRVVDTQGKPIQGARVTVAGSNSVHITNATGTFSLDSLPAGSQVLLVRKVGFEVAEKPIELSGVAAATAEVRLEEATQTLAAVRTVASREKDLDKVGFTRRKSWAGGYQFQGEQINRHAETFTQSLVGFPSLRIVRSGTWADRYVIQDMRDLRSCVVFFVDGAQWKTMTPGDIDEFVKPYDVQAIEIYRAASIPPEFVAVGAGRCMTIVVWTKNKIRGGG